MGNPFEKKVSDRNHDLRLVTGALTGNRDDLEALLIRHQPWIYNISLRMLCDPDDAADVTQEIVIKIITKLSSYDPEKSAFRTWLYRVVVNHILNMKKRGYEVSAVSLDEYFDVDSIPDKDLSSRPENSVLLDELKINCFLGSLLCFDRKQRMVFILGAILNIPDSVGSEIMAISKSNFRKILERSRHKLGHFVNQKCGLLNDANPCHCSKKLESLIETGMMNPARIVFHNERAPTVKSVLLDRVKEIEQYNLNRLEAYNRMFLDHPFYESTDLLEWLREVTDTEKIMQLLKAPVEGGIH